MFHVVAEGRCWVALRRRSQRHVSRGDVVVMPYGDGHAFGSLEPADAVSITTLLPPPPWTEFPLIDHGGQGERTQIVCGYLRGDAVLFDPVLRALPSLFVVRPPRRPGGSLGARQRRLRPRGLVSAPGTAGSWTHRRLPQLLFTEVLRLYLHEGPTPS